MLMGATLAMAFGLMAASAPAEFKVFQDACLSATPVTREDLRALAHERRWPKGVAETPADLEWRDYYQAGRAIIRLDQHRVSQQNPGERICVVLVGDAPARWRDQVSALVADGVPVGPADTYDAERYQMPAELELVVWDLPGGSRIHALRGTDNILELSVNYPVSR